jgi:serine/threonine-protein kinase HipA
MKMINRCHICYNPVSSSIYHKQCLKKIFNTEVEPIIDFNQNDIERLAKQYVKQKMGIPGVQRKLSLDLQKPRKDIDDEPTRLTIVGYLGGGYILKPPTASYPYMPEIEDLTMHLASLAGMRVALHGLIPMSDGQYAYITKRFDRKGKQKIAVEDCCQLSNKLTENKYKGSIEQLGRLIKHYSSNPGNDAIEFFKLIVFSFLVGNADMHLKNFSLITNDLNNIHLSPYYDLLATKLLIPSHLDEEELALPVNGKKSNLRRKDFVILGQNLEIPSNTINYLLENMVSFFPDWMEMIKKSFLSKELKKQFSSLIDGNIRRIQ